MILLKGVYLDWFLYWGNCFVYSYNYLGGQHFHG